MISIAGFDKELKRLAKEHPSLNQDYSELLNELEFKPKLGMPKEKTVVRCVYRSPVRVKVKERVARTRNNSSSHQR